ncbi:hypothetical protein CHS0354_040873 [Potamilus streckersoni]|uniref:Receptor ligand binding region domain-containing protein n=1 Tax=Potamilus streckersoni TaxID=2493646 RepID=A0AAE0VXU3_9BIVA|nr:hypothetical protein CHS0354_040873 [Potamilus streckersoni]
MTLQQMSYADTDPTLSDRKKYNNFYRTVPSDNDFNLARIALLKHFNWTRVGTIFQSALKGPARYGHAHNHLVSLLEMADIAVVKVTGFVNEPESAVTELKILSCRLHVRHIIIPANTQEGKYVKRFNVKQHGLKPDCKNALLEPLDVEARLKKHITRNI